MFDPSLEIAYVRSQALGAVLVPFLAEGNGLFQNPLRRRENPMAGPDRSATFSFKFFTMSARHFCWLTRLSSALRYLVWAKRRSSLPAMR